jgi:acetoacetate decarboxylase
LLNPQPAQVSRSTLLLHGDAGCADHAAPELCFGPHELTHFLGIIIKGAWTGPGALSLNPHALAPVAELPVLEIVSALHILSDLTLGLGKVVHDYLA